ncbi:ras guanine nucleotide exchange factor domain-containing protein [Bisporella sp. PMI_857]|nr:ras guanine nucleotide exchange factor domain-containing protein [Bisporella sp. PMI_857]
MDEVSLLPSYAQSKRRRSSSSRDKHHREQGSKTSPSSPRSSSRPSLSSRTSSAPLVPLSKELPKLTTIEDEFNTFNFRDSVSSIKDDPFFRNYQTPQSVSLARELRVAAYNTDNSRDGTLPKLSPPRSDKKNATSNSVNLPPQSRSGMADINIAIIGSAGVGKSTLIQRALGLRELPTSSASSLQMSVDNVLYTVSLIELDLESFDMAPNRTIHWPKQINGQILPHMDGALLLYDVMNRESITELPQTLNALVNSSLPTILVSCKCDNPRNTRQIDVESMEAACLSCVEAFKTAANVPESARLCLSSILRAIMANRNSKAVEATAGPRRRAISSTHLEKVPESGASRPISQQSKHGRASSEYSVTRGTQSPITPGTRGQPPLSRNAGRTNLHHQFTLPDPHDAPPLSAHPVFRNESSLETTDPASRAPAKQSRTPIFSSQASGKAVDNSFLDMEESDADSSYRYSDDIPILQRNDDSFFDKPAKVAGVTFEELVDRLLDQHMSRADNNFAEIFLCLYRKFAAPGELFQAILDRLQHIADDKNIHYLTRTADQLRIITVIAKWLSSYPGDFAGHSTSSNLDTFITQLAGNPVFAAAAQDMRLQLQSRVVEDDDTAWARTDADVELESRTSTESTPSSPTRRRANTRDFVDEMHQLQIEDSLGEKIEQKESTTDSLSSARPYSPSRSLAPSFHTVEDYEREAATMVPKAALPLTKIRYHIFMDTSDDDFAEEMTRIDWVMFSSIRLRDLVRHVSLPIDQKEKCKSLANVNRMINHFNHIAKWVANMILMRDKAKHRAQMMEKFMNIALKLRQQNNYNGLAAVLAGINGTAIHRLAQTRLLVHADVQKRFARLVLLMGTQKSHFAYRLAWENSPLPRIPYIPLHRRDLVSAEEGNLTFVGAKGDRINWKKFEVLAEVILPIMKSQITPYFIPNKHDIARELILDCKMPTDDEDIYQRSLQVESSSGATDYGKKKFPWFQKDK